MSGKPRKRSQENKNGSTTPGGGRTATKNNVSSQSVTTTNKLAALSTVERVCKDVAPIATRRLGDSDVFAGGKINPEVVKGHFMKEGRLKEETATRIVREAIVILKKESTVLDLQAPLTICGDIHGQFYDLVHLFDVGGQLHDTKYLFLGYTFVKFLNFFISFFF